MRMLNCLNYFRRTLTYQLSDLDLKFDFDQFENQRGFRRTHHTNLSYVSYFFLHIALSERKREHHLV